MKTHETIFNSSDRSQLITRIGNLTELHTPGWGKMNIHQMLKHNIYWNQWILGKGSPVYKQVFMGKLFGKIALNKMIKDKAPFDRNIPTSAQFKFPVTDGDVLAGKTDWILLLSVYDHFHNPNFVHDFFGKMTQDQIGILVYKHTDHHLRQFNV